MGGRHIIVLAAVAASSCAWAQSSGYWYMGSTSRVYTTVEKAYVSLNYEGNPSGLTVEVFYGPAQGGLLTETNVQGRAPVSVLRPNLRPAARGRYSSGAVLIPTKEPGYYMVRATLGQRTRTTSFTVSDLALVAKSAPSSTLVWVLNRRTGEPVAGAAVKAIRGGQVLASGATDQQGFWVTPRLEGEYELVALRGQHVARFTPYYARSEGQPSASLVYMYTDRSVYRPGDTVHFKGIARDWVAGEYVEASGRSASVELRNSYDATLQTQEIVSSSSGSFDGSFKLSESLVPGTYWVRADLGDGMVGSAAFDIAEYRKPEYRVTLTPSANPVIAGENLVFRLEAKYYFGAPLAGASVRWSAFVNQDWYGWNRFLPKDDWEPQWDESEGENEDGGYAWGDTRFEGTGKTGPDGVLLIEVPASVRSKVAERPVGLTVSAEVLDIAGREGSTSATAYLLPAARFAEVEPASWVGPVGQSAEMKVRTWDVTLGRSVPGAPVRIEIVRYWWEQSGKEWRERSEVQERRDLTVGEDGNGTFQFVPRVAGSYRLVAIMQDGSGRASRYESYYYAHGGAGGYWGGRERLQIQPSTRRARAGDTLTVLFQTGTPNATLWYSIEGSTIHHHGLLKASGGVAVLNIPITREMMPCIYVWGGYAAEGVLQSDSVGVWIADESKLLDLRVTPDSDRHLPGDKVRYRIESRDLQGNPIPAEVSLAVVDEPLFAIRRDNTPDIRAYFYGSRPNSVETERSDALYYRIVTGASAPDAIASLRFARVYQKEARDAEKTQAGEGRVRKEFRDTAFWRATIETDETGQAEVEFTLPDNLTQWRATARGVGEGTSVGQAVNKELRVTKPLIASLNLPRFVSVGDEFRVIAVVRNTTDRVQTAQVVFEADEHLAVLTRPETSVMVPANGEWRYDISARAAKSGTCTVYLAATSQTHQDAVELRLNVLEYRNLQTRTQSGVTAGTVSQPIPLAKDRTLGSESLEFRISPTLTSLLLGSVEALAQYPYGCIEQTTSPMLADLALLDVLSAEGRSRPELEAKLRDMVQVGLSRLYAMQEYDGGWGWGDHSESDLYWTAYVMSGLAEARRSGFQVDDDTFRRGLDRLATMVVRVDDSKPRGAKPADEATWRYRSALQSKTLALEVLSRIQPEAWRTAAERMAARTGELAPAGLARLAMTLKNVGHDALAGKVMRELIGKGRQGGGLMSWPADYRDESWWYYGEQDTQVAALALQAMCELGTSSSERDAVLQWLCSARRGDMWYSTNDTATIARALATYIRTTGERPFTGRVTLAVDGRNVQSWEIGRDHGQEIVGKVGPELLQGSTPRWELRLEGSGSLRYAVTTRYNLPYAQRASGAGIAVSRTYRKLVTKVVTHKSGSYTWTEQQYSTTSPVSSVVPGDEVVVKLVVKSDRPLRHLVLEDPLPAGLEPIDERNSEFLYSGWLFDDDRYDWYGYARREQHDNRVTLLLEHVPSGETAYYYVVRAVTPGSFTAGPAVVSAMYAAGIEGRSETGRISVRVR
ncbi:MAG: hypothetical protein AMXMBFR61_09160 [Fimbriimonadales bacterium]